MKTTLPIFAAMTLVMPSAFAKASSDQTIVEIAAGNKDFSTLVAAVKAAGLADTLGGDGPFTVFAPTNEAFAKLPAGTVETLLKPENKEKLASILTYHVVAAKVMAADVKPGQVKTVNGNEFKLAVSDGKVTVDGATVIKTDIVGNNGVIHVIDHVILPPTKTVVEIAAGNEDFSTLVAAVKAAGLVDTLSGDGPFTVFAPTNEAFAKLPKGTVESLLKPENKEKLAAILTYHVVAGKVMAADVKSGKVATVNGKSLKLAVSDAGVMVDSAKVLKTDIVGTNGVIHVIDSVILPAS